MWIIGCDFHPSWQQVAWLDVETGETGEAKLEHKNGEAERWYGQLPVPSLIGLEATGNCDWFVELLQKLGHDRLRAHTPAKRLNFGREERDLLRPYPGLRAQGSHPTERKFGARWGPRARSTRG